MWPNFPFNATKKEAFLFEAEFEKTVETAGEKELIVDLGSCEYRRGRYKEAFYGIRRS